MKLQSLALHNFGSYADAEVHLDGIAAAVICGMNGAGKSTAFVDAPLWALFGKCRTDTDHMVRIGDQDMMVTLTFQVNGAGYRVIRKRSLKTKAGKSELALMVQQGEDWMPVAVGMAEATTQIEALLNLDYDLLTATGFLLQGKADRFSKASPAERKAILAQILQLDRYADLRQKASRWWTAKTAAIEEKGQLLTHYRGASVDLTALEAAFLAGEDRCAQLKRQIAEAEVLLEDIRQARMVLVGEIAALDGIKAQVAEDTARLSTVQQRAKDLAARRDQLQDLLDQKVAIAEKVAEETEAQGVLEDLRNKEQGLDHHLNERAAEIRTIHAELAKGADLRAERDRCQLKMAETVRDYEQETARLARELEELRRAIAMEADRYEARTASMQEEVERDERAVQLLGQVPCDVMLQGRCQFTKDAVAAKERLSMSKPALAARWTIRAVIQEELAPGKTRERLDLEHRYQARATERGDIERQAGDALRADLLKASDELTAWTAKGWAIKLTAAQALEDQARNDKAVLLQKIAAHERTLKELAQYLPLLAKVSEAERQLPQILSDLAAFEQEVSQLTEKLATSSQRLKRSGSLDEQIREQDQRIAAQNALKESSSDAATAEAQAQGDRAAHIKTAKAALEQAEAITAQLDALAIEARQYDLLTQAYQAIPVLIMESAIPMLAEEANRVLSKISRAGMRVRLETQKALKSREGLAETLDIIIRDVHGERPYENYSGGERFRVDLAIRIGLTKMLASRAGARLETLVIDEGLGSLDEDGLSQLRDCLAQLGDEFPLVLVVTHVEAMKHTFPAQIVVSKTDQGSVIEVLA